MVLFLTNDLVPAWALAALSLLTLVIVLVSCVVIIPPQHAAVIERFGTYSRTLQSGINLVVPIADQYHRYRWTNFTSNGQKKRDAYAAPLLDMRSGRVLDIPASECLTRDEMQVTLDGILYYRVTNVVDATYKNQDPTDMIATIAQQALRNAASTRTLKELTQSGRDTSIASLIVDHIEEELQKNSVGIKCERFLFQQSKAQNDKIIKENQELVAARHRAELEAHTAKLKADQEAAAANRKIEAERIQTEAKHRAALDKVKYEMELEQAALEKSRLFQERLNFEAEQESKRRALKDGVTPDRAYELARLNVLVKSIANAKTVFLPTDMLKNPAALFMTTQQKQEEEEEESGISVEEH